MAAAARTKTKAKAKSKRPTLTPEERKARAEAAQAQLAAEVEKLRDSGRWTQFLTTAARFRQYSMTNVLLILAQKPEATRVAGFRKWQELGYQVRKGEKAIRINGFATKKVEDEKAENGERVVKYFPTVSVFDISQCDPIPGVEQADFSPLAHRLDGDDELGIFDAVASFLEDRGWSVRRTDIPGEANGLTRIDGSKIIEIDNSLSPRMASKTAIHEAAHALLHAEGDDRQATENDYMAHRGVYETEAESVAYIVADSLGMDTSDYSVGYIAGWSGCAAAVVKSTAKRAIDAAHTILNAIDPIEKAEAAGASDTAVAA